MNSENTEKKEMCLWFEQGVAACSLNGSICCWPFSKEGCEIQCKEIFKEEPNDLNSNRYKSINNAYINKIFTKVDVFKEIGLRKDMAIAEWFIPYYEIDMMAASPSAPIKYGIDMVKKKLKESNYHADRTRIFYNVKIGETIGVYILGVDLYAD